MKFIHTSDWHLGRILHGIHLTQDQKIILDGLKDVLQQEKPDALVIAGDIYDRSIPPVEAIELFNEFIETVLLDMQIPIIAMAGNHDSAERIQFGRKLLSQNNLHMIGKTKRGYEKVILQDEHGEVEFYIVPYADPAYIRNIHKQDHIKNHNDAMQYIIELIQQEKNGARSVMIAHGFVQGGDIFSESERPLSIGGTDIISADHFAPFNYTALGHLHAPQRAGADTIRYSGSLMKYSISEATQKKGVYVIDMDGQGDVSYREISIAPPKDVREVRGLLDDILVVGRSDENCHDYIMAIIEDEGALLDPMEKIRSVYPNAIGMRRTFLERQQHAADQKINYNNYNQMGIGSLFKDFYSLVTGEEFTKEYQEVFENITQGLERE